MAHDAEVYPDPFHFDPSRHLGEKPQLDPFKFVFGFGKRLCPGIHLAELSLFLNMARILSLFDISKPVDVYGNDIDQKVDWTDGIISYVPH
jgi:cytochrome P450